MSTTGKFRMNEGDWVCSDPQCGNVNFARRATCNRCGKGQKIAATNIVQEKTAIPQRKKLGHEIGKAAAEKSRGLFSADDWQCGRCGNVNWARRQQCNMCNAPKFGEVEERTGLGGGYNERENIEYIEREESDGEYDDFGRKKKKFRGNPEDEEPPKSRPKVIQEEKKEEKDDISKYKLNDNEDEEDEDEEEDDDADLSKYDLTGWGDDFSPKKDKKNQSSSRSRSSSSSQSSASSHSRSSSHSSQSSRSSRSSSRSSSGSEKPAKSKRTNSRSRSSSSESKNQDNRHHQSGSSRSQSPYRSRSRSRDRDRSRSVSPDSQKR